MRTPADLGPAARFLGALAAWGALALASPGVLDAAGSPALAALGVGVWAAVEARPPRGAAWKGFLAHALGALPGAAAIMLWIRFVYWPPLLYIGLGMGIYSAAGGALLRRLLPAARPALAPLCAGLAWTAMETLRAWVPMPFGLGWMRVGTHAHAWLPLAEGARVLGVSGLTLALASVGGLAAYASRSPRAALRPAALAAGLGPALACLALGWLTSAPATEPGPRVLIVQPGFPQARKQFDDALANFNALRDQTRAALAELRARGEPEPDLVAWGESMLYLDVVTEEAAERIRAAARGDADAQAAVAALGGRAPGAEHLADIARAEDVHVRRRILGLRADGTPADGGGGAGSGAGVLPAGTSFLAGAEVYLEDEGELTRWNGVVLYDARGARSRPAGKRYLVPGAETMYGLERVGWVRDFVLRVSGYVPSFRPAPRTEVLPLETRDGRSFGVAATVCFDNAHLDPYLDPVAAASAAVDFHLVVSNEAWYETSFEVDQMIAFSRIAAIASGRTIVRATNSGISCAIGPDGRELGRIVVGGADRMVKGSLALDVPVPLAGTRPPTVIAVLLRPLDALWVALPCVWALAAALRRRRAGAPTGPVGNPDRERG